MGKSTGADGRRRVCRLAPDAWRGLLLGAARPAWIVWPRLYLALELAWLLLWREDPPGLPPLAQASVLRRGLQDRVTGLLDRSGPDFACGDCAAHPGESLIPFFTERMRALLDKVTAGT